MSDSTTHNPGHAVRQGHTANHVMTASADKILPAKRPHDADDDHLQSKTTSSMFSRLFGPRRQSVTREDFDKTWGRLEERKEYYKGRTETLVNEAVIKNRRIKELEREVNSLHAQLVEKQVIVRSILGNIDGFFGEFKTRFAGEYEGEDDEEEEEEEEGEEGGDKPEDGKEVLRKPKA